MRFICITAIALSIMNSGLAMADPLDNTNEFIEKMANEGGSQNNDEVSQPGNNSSIEWGLDTTDNPDQRTDQQADDEIAESAKIRDEGKVQKKRAE
jgi:hypothetical protein